MLKHKPNVFKIGDSGLFTCYKKYFEKVPHNQIPSKMYRRTHNYFDYYYDFYKIIPIDDSRIEIKITDRQDRETKILTLTEPLKKGNSYVNIHIPVKIFRQYNKYKYWSIEAYDEKTKSIYIIKNTIDEYNETIQRKADRKKRGE